MTIGERPGIYADYEVSGISYSGTASGIVGIAAVAAGAEAGKVLDITSYAAAVSSFGSDSAMTELIGLLIKNGVETVKAVAVAEGATAEDYTAAFGTLAANEDVKIIVCDSALADVHKALKETIESADERNRYKVGIVEGSGTVSELTAAAVELNSERIVMVAPAALKTDGTGSTHGSLAAAVAGAVIKEADPAIPLNGAALYGLGGVSESYTDGDMTLLIRGGITPVECVGGTVSVVRGITTRTETGGVKDATYRELTTTLIIDNVVPAVRDALRSNFSRVKNNERTRGAIRTRVVVELEKKLKAEIIDGYDNVTVTQNSDDPTICDVSFEFAVTHGLNQIRLTAYISV